MKKHKIFANPSGGVILLTASNLIVKAVGLLFKIPMTALIGEEGMGYFNGAYTIFTWLYTLSCAGLPTAASMLIARMPEKQRADGAKRVFRLSLGIFTLVGLIGCISLIVGAPFIAHLTRVEESEAAIIAVAPTLFFICQSAALRGYFQGFGELRWHSISQVIEALGKLLIGVALAYFALERGLGVPTAAAYAAGGITVGVGAGMLSLYIAYAFTKRRHLEREATNSKTLVCTLVVTMLPITLSSSVMSLTNIIDTMLMTRTLHASGMAQAEVAAIWGNYSSLAVPMFNLPPVLTLPIAYALLPSLSAAIASKHTDRAISLTHDAAKSTAFFAVPCAIGMSAMAKPILSLLFADDVAARGAILLTLLAPSSMLLCMLGLTNTILQASGHERVPLIAMLAGAAAKLAATWILTPSLGKYATPVSTFICYLTALIISVAAIAARTPLGTALFGRVFAKSTITSLIAVTLAAILYPMIGTVGAIGAAAAAYFAIMAIGKEKRTNT